MRTLTLGVPRVIVSISTDARLRMGVSIKIAWMASAGMAGRALGTPRATARGLIFGVTGGTAIVVPLLVGCEIQISEPHGGLDAGHPFDHLTIHVHKLIEAFVGRLDDQVGDVLPVHGQATHQRATPDTLDLKWECV